MKLVSSDYRRRVRELLRAIDALAESEMLCVDRAAVNRLHAAAREMLELEPMTAEDLRVRELPGGATA